MSHAAAMDHGALCGPGNLVVPGTESKGAGICPRDRRVSPREVFERVQAETSAGGRGIFPAVCRRCPCGPGNPCVPGRESTGAGICPRDRHRCPREVFERAEAETSAGGRGIFPGVGRGCPEWLTRVGPEGTRRARRGIFPAVCRRCPEATAPRQPAQPAASPHSPPPDRCADHYTSRHKGHYTARRNNLPHISPTYHPPPPPAQPAAQRNGCSCTRIDTRIHIQQGGEYQ